MNRAKNQVQVIGDQEFQRLKSISKSFRKDEESEKVHTLVLKQKCEWWL